MFFSKKVLFTALAAAFAGSKQVLGHGLITGGPRIPQTLHALADDSMHVRVRSCHGREWRHDWGVR